MTVTRRFRQAIAILFVLALVLTACGGEDSVDTTAGVSPTTEEPTDTTGAPGTTGATETTEAPMETASIVVQSGAPAPNITDLPVYVGQEAGFFESEGLEVTVQYGEGGSLAAQLASAGQVDISTNTYEPNIEGYAEGLRGKVFFEVNDRLTYYISVLANSDVQEVADLEGATLGAASLGSTAIPVAQIMLERAGVDPESVTFLPVGIGAPAAAALESGDVDGLALWNGAFAAIQGSGTELREIRDEELAGFGNGGTWTSDAFIEDNPDLVERYSRGLAKSLALIAEHPDVAARIYFAVNPEAEESLGFDATVAQIEFVGRDFDTESPYGEIDLDNANTFIELFAQVRDIAEPPAAEDIMTNEFIDAANDFDPAEVTEAAEAYGS